MNAAPLISVIMPVYNVEAFVGEAIQSVLCQSFANWELLIIDDGGADASMAICRMFTDKRIRIITQANRGLAGARNTGIAHARGRYIALLDSNDRWHPSKLMMHVIHLEANASVDVSYAGSRMIDAAGQPLKAAMRPRLSGITPAHILKRNPVGNGSAAVMRRASLNRVAFAHPNEPGRTCWFDESFRQSEDMELWLRLSATHGCRFEGIEGLLTDHRIVASGLSANIARQYESWERAIAKTAATSPRLIARHGRQAMAYQLRDLARCAIQLGDGSFGWSLALQAVQAGPAMLIAEPRKTLTTLVAALAARLRPTAQFQALTAHPIGDGAQA